VVAAASWGGVGDDLRRRARRTVSMNTCVGRNLLDPNQKSTIDERGRVKWAVEWGSPMVKQGHTLQWRYGGGASRPAVQSAIRRINQNHDSRHLDLSDHTRVLFSYSHTTKGGGGSVKGVERGVRNLSIPTPVGFERQPLSAPHSSPSSSWRCVRLCLWDVAVSRASQPQVLLPPPPSFPPSPRCSSFFSSSSY
jgi:hypothetical protein